MTQIVHLTYAVNRFHTLHQASYECQPHTVITNTPSMHALHEASIYEQHTSIAHMQMQRGEPWQQGTMQIQAHTACITRYTYGKQASHSNSYPYIASEMPHLRHVYTFP